MLVCNIENGTEGVLSARDGEPAIPSFPTGDPTTFLGTDTLLPAYCARVEDLPDFDPDKLLDKLAERFEGLPREYLRRYVLGSATWAAKLEEGQLVRVAPGKNGRDLVERENMTTLGRIVNDVP